MKVWHAWSPIACTPRVRDPPADPAPGPKRPPPRHVVPLWRYRLFLTNTDLADVVDRRRAIIETVFADVVRATDPYARLLRRQLGLNPTARPSPTACFARQACSPVNGTPPRWPGAAYKPTFADHLGVKRFGVIRS
jgi:hypothetical protein